MPSEHYMVEAKLIFGTAPADVPRSEDIRTAIKDIWDIRAAKLRTSMDDFIKGEGTYAKLDHLTIMEIHSVRPLLPHSLDLIARLERVLFIFESTTNLFINVNIYFFQSNRNAIHFLNTMHLPVLVVHILQLINLQQIFHLTHQLGDSSYKFSIFSKNSSV